MNSNANLHILGIGLVPSPELNAPRLVHPLWWRYEAGISISVSEM